MRRRGAAVTALVVVSGTATGLWLTSPGGGPPKPGGQACGSVSTTASNHVDREHGRQAAAALNGESAVPSRVPIVQQPFVPTTNDQEFRDTVTSQDALMKYADLVALGNVTRIRYAPTGINVDIKLTTIDANNGTNAKVGDTVRVCYPHLPFIRNGKPALFQDQRFGIPPKVGEQVAVATKAGRLLPVLGGLGLDPGGSAPGATFPVFWRPLVQAVIDRTAGTTRDRVNVPAAELRGLPATLGSSAGERTTFWEHVNNVMQGIGRGFKRFGGVIEGGINDLSGGKQGAGAHGGAEGLAPTHGSPKYVPDLSQPATVSLVSFTVTPPEHALPSPRQM